MKNKKLIAQIQAKRDELAHAKSEIPKTCVSKHRGMQLQLDVWEEVLGMAQ